MLTYVRRISTTFEYSSKCVVSHTVYSTYRTTRNVYDRRLQSQSEIIDEQAKHERLLALAVPAWLVVIMIPSRIVVLSLLEPTF